MEKCASETNAIISSDHGHKVDDGDDINVDGQHVEAADIYECSGLRDCLPTTTGDAEPMDKKSRVVADENGTSANHERTPNNSGTVVKTTRGDRLQNPTNDAGSGAKCRSGSTGTEFYGVCIPVNHDEASDSGSGAAQDANKGDVQTVFTDKQEVLKAVKKFRGARFKSFKSYEEAANFSKLPANHFVTSQSSLMLQSPTTPSDVIGSSNSVNLERGTLFRVPKAQELVKLRKGIESGDVEFFCQTVWANPRYLISSGDTPTILQEGSRYNALHIVAKAKQPAMCRVILDTIEDVKFMQLLYNDDSPSTRLQRIDFLVDLYLNMPDKALCETPLHFATKFGCLKIVEMMSSHPACDKGTVNKYNQTPKDVICTRCSSSFCPDLQKQIEEALEDHYFVPVYATEDNSQQPVLGEPWSPCRNPPEVSLPVRGKNPLSSSSIVRACAGPMSPKQADEFYHKWKTPPFVKSSTPAWWGRARVMGIRLSDTDKGLERIGRELAKEHNVSWIEHWSFLGAFCNLATPDGLNKLEMYLRNKYNEMSSEAKNDLSQDAVSLDRSGAAALIDSSFGSSVFEDTGTSVSSLGSSLVGSLCHMFGRMKIRTSSESSWPPTSDSSQHIIIGTARNGTRNHLSIERESLHPVGRTVNAVEHICHDIANMVTHEVFDCISRPDIGHLKIANPKREFVDSARPGIECLLRMVSNDPSTCAHSELHRRIAGHVIQTLRDEFWDEGILALQNMPVAAVAMLSSDDESTEDDLPRFRKYPASGSATKVTVQQHLCCIFRFVLMLAKDKGGEVVCCCKWAGNGAAPSRNLNGSPGATRTGDLTDLMDSDDVFSDDSMDVSYHTPPSSIISSYSSSYSDAQTPEESLLVFINGMEPSKLDVDVFRALEGCHIDPVMYPHTVRWRHLVSSYTKEELERWRTPSTASGRGTQPRRPVSVSRLSMESWSPVVPPNRECGSLPPGIADDLSTVQTNLYESIFQDLVNE